MSKLKMNKTSAMFFKRLALAVCVNLIFGISAMAQNENIPSATIVVSNTNDSGAGSLRAAILQANASTGVPDTINFTVAPNSIISPASPLPTITDTISTMGAPVEINGAAAGAAAYGLRINAPNCLIQGIAVTGFQQGGIRIEPAGNVANVQVSQIGVNALGVVKPNISRGIAVIGATGVLITGNTISGNTGNGIEITAGGSATIRNNRIGTSSDGLTDAGNTAHGILIALSSNSIIGGTTAGDRNIISGNNGNGVLIAADVDFPASNNTVAGNFIGVNANGTVALPNNGSGVVVQGANNIIGSTLTGGRNVISGNSVNGISISTSLATNNVVRGNLIGVGSNGTTAVANAANGIQISTFASNNAIGGSGVTAGQCDGDCNVIANNGSVNSLSATAGIYLDISAGAGNQIRANRIFGNFGTGIDLGTKGNADTDRADAGDADTGANNLQNPPVLTSANNAEFIGGTLNSTSNTFFVLDFYVNDALDGMMSEGRTYIGSLNVLTNNSGVAFFSFNTTVALNVGQFVTATATSINLGNARLGGDAPQGFNDTSEYSNAQIVTVILPTAATVTVSGRVNVGGRNLHGVSMALFDTASGETFYAMTDINGVYRFNDVPVGEDYIITPQRIGYTFSPANKFLSLTEEMTNVDFTAVPDKGRRRF